MDCAYCYHNCEGHRLSIYCDTFFYIIINAASLPRLLTKTIKRFVSALLREGMLENYSFYNLIVEVEVEGKAQIAVKSWRHCRLTRSLSILRATCTLGLSIQGLLPTQFFFPMSRMVFPWHHDDQPSR